MVSKSGQLLMVHSALGQFNNVEGGPSSILKSLLDAIGPQGTLIVPTFPHWGTVMKTMSPFDVNNTTSAMGVLSELVRRDARACRSMHPTHPVAAIGPRAEDIIVGHETEPYAFGLNSPFWRHAEAGGKILMLGVDLNSLTSFHIYEDLIAPTPWLPVYETAPRTFPMISMDGSNFTYTGYFHDASIAARRDVERMRPTFEAVGALHWIKTDFSHIGLLDSRAVVTTCLTELLAGYSAYGPITVPEAERARIIAATPPLAKTPLAGTGGFGRTAVG